MSERYYRNEVSNRREYEGNRGWQATDRGRYDYEKREGRDNNYQRRSNTFEYSRSRRETDDMQSRQASDRRRYDHGGREKYVRKSSYEYSGRRERSRSNHRTRSDAENQNESDDSKIPKPRMRRTSVHERPTITPADLEDKTEEEKEMIMMMGFSSFDSTKGRYLALNPDEKIDMDDYYD